MHLWPLQAESRGLSAFVACTRQLPPTSECARGQLHETSHPQEQAAGLRDRVRQQPRSGFRGVAGRSPAEGVAGDSAAAPAQGKAFPLMIHLLARPKFVYIFRTH